METHQLILSGVVFFFSAAAATCRQKGLITSLEVSLRLIGGAPVDPSVAQCCFVTTVSPGADRCGADTDHWAAVPIVTTSL